jgi:hypothetical protein
VLFCPRGLSQFLLPPHTHIEDPSISSSKSIGSGREHALYGPCPHHAHLPAHGTAFNMCMSKGKRGEKQRRRSCYPSLSSLSDSSW